MMIKSVVVWEWIITYGCFSVTIVVLYDISFCLGDLYNDDISCSTPKRNIAALLLACFCLKERITHTQHAVIIMEVNSLGCLGNVAGR